MEIRKAEMIARDLMNFYRLESWHFKFSNALSYFGYCYWNRKLITLSKNLVSMNSEEKVIDTILHEIAHALAPRYVNHGKEWKQIAQAIGCPPIRCYDKTVMTPAKRYIGICPKCGYTINRHRRRKISCGKCDPNYNSSLLFKWSEK